MMVATKKPPSPDRLSPLTNSYEFIAKSVFEACSAEQMWNLLGNRAFDEAAVYEVYRAAQGLLAKLDGKS